MADILEWAGDQRIVPSGKWTIRRTLYTRLLMDGTWFTIHYWSV